MVFPKDKVDYSLYLVTDSTMLPEGTTLYSQVEAGLKNGVTLVQLREKDTDTKIFIEEAIAVQKLCKAYDVPLIINDRIDVALAIDADGVHVGQSDMPIPMVRQLLGPDKIVGWSVGKTSEVETLAQWGTDMVDYIGIGMVFPTETKKNPRKSPMGPTGVIDILNALETTQATWCRTVAIGGLHPNNIPRVLYQCVSHNGKRALDGISVVSDIMASDDAGASTKILRGLLDYSKFEYIPLDFSHQENITSKDIKDTLSQVQKNHPLVQHMTNKVHQNFGANVTLALGSSPIMSEVPSEVDELASVPNAALLLNTGSVAPVEALKEAVRAYNERKRPIIFDPVGYSATQTRLTLNNTLLQYGQYTCIKGNSGEILSLAKLNQGKMRGVDAGDDKVDKALLARATRLVAFTYKTIAVCTGEYDFIADGTMSSSYRLGHGVGELSANDIPCVMIEDGPIPLMEKITASGCSLGTAIAALVGGLSPNGIAFNAVVSAVLLYKSAGKLASLNCRGSGSFHVHLIDALDQLFTTNDPSSWTAKVEIVT
ncbi:bifunctional hydroxyethylthiazole kinase/thiamine-phosphate diphosphorylase NDAI_0F01540 [Naumovozyma dairenensis CBS 421]|uniref:Thiamine phosphate synthase/TenI domain-containing protein n=1 Tax=Naumovozyma dairenensis (strain ATCC 10597 / BCRC 20456 / CBS 421 / NBRC 0211 / NRRL Y-12639) TaxID=1071378 RepID=G0WCG2_NAUDC|nr:hypothetical protein NDAI_0F01540 [Naumovozyma dairenensis CBS 421]CCD25473.1 hypothetical protein NDAI_0F01540 [Naumovozyma dairenensis CBS 421]